MRGARWALLGLLATTPFAAAQVPDCGMVPGWTQKGEAREFVPDNLFDYMDGGAEGYLIYDFVKMNGVTCEQGDASLAFDVSVMKNAGGAWGLFISNHDRRRPTEKIGTIGQVMPSRATFAKGNYFVEITSNGSGDHSAAMRAFLTAMEKRLTGSTTPPVEVGWFPPENLVPDSIRMVPESVLGMRALPRGFVAEYSFGKAFLALTSSPEEAVAAIAKVRERYPEAAPAGVGDDSFLATDRYLGRVLFFRKGPNIAGYTDLAEGQDTAALIRTFAARLP